MSTDASRRLRADAARNSERILRAAREVFAECGPGAMLEDIARRRAGVGIATLYRRFSNKEALVRAAVELSITEQLSPAIERALGDDDPRQGLATLLHAALAMMARGRDTLAAADNSGDLTGEVTAPFNDALELLVLDSLSSVGASPPPPAAPLLKCGEGHQSPPRVSQEQGPRFCRPRGQVACIKQPCCDQHAHRHNEGRFPSLRKRP
ncbi:helix-turn-helix transcriptional regulator [Streptomyces montanus]|uniref:Helix-turn-helix transcriptional regulator n=1 Tax=Streptomyces montanus TaxID=2580423 RepID=A0A5R9G180_9ACTN|nr:helix-turn-helix domain-containing protein [Streptomyces montanus]TLS48066.1 helix-turn-helix transcriptional regulator [Streptomyces montanus]